MTEPGTFVAGVVVGLVIGFFLARRPPAPPAVEVRDALPVWAARRLR